MGVDKSDKPAKPRRPHPSPEQKADRARLHETRVEYVADLMRTLKFRTGVTGKALAKEWDLPLSYVGQVTVEASRRVRAELTDPDRVLSKVSVALDHVIDDALDSGDRHAIIKAVQVWAQVTGAGAATKVQVTNDLTALTPEQLQARKAEILARMTGKSTELPSPIDVPALPEST